MIKILPPFDKYKYDTWRILMVKCYIDNSVHLRSSIQNVNTHRWWLQIAGSGRAPEAFSRGSDRHSQNRRCRHEFNTRCARGGSATPGSQLGHGVQWPGCWQEGPTRQRFLVLKINPKSDSTMGKKLGNKEKSGKNRGSRKCNLEHFSLLELLPNLHRF
jgi:hypothetical protein